MADETVLRGMVGKAAEEAGLDPEFVSRLVDAENGGRAWRTDRVSPKGAMGLMQVLPSTAKEVGVVGNLSDPEVNIRAGVGYLKKLSEKYGGRPDLLAAAYNAGPGAVAKAGGVPNYKETQAYVAQVDPFAKWRSGEAQKPAAAGEDPFAKWRTAPTEQAKTEQPAQQAPTGGDDIVGMRTDPQARTERINRNLEQQQAITHDTLLGMPAMGQAVGAALRGAGAATEYLGQAAGKIPWYAREIGAHLAGLGTPGYVAAALGPKATQLAGRATSAVGRAIPKILGTAAEETAPAAEAVAAKAPIAGEGPGGAGWYQPWEGAERERIVAGKGTAGAQAQEPAAPAQPAAPAAGSGQPLTVVGSPASKFWIAKNKLGVKVNAQQMPKAIALIRDGMEPEAAIKQVIGGSGATPAEELAKQLGTPSDAEVTADMGKRARAGQKTLMGRYGDQ